MSGDCNSDNSSESNRSGPSIGTGKGVFIIAEAGVNHDGDLDQARALIDAAHRAGADAVKFQAFSAARLASADAPKCTYQQRNSSADGASSRADESQADMLRRLELSTDDFSKLKQHAAQRGIMFLCTPFGLIELDMLVALSVPAIKIASPDIVNVPLLTAAARCGLPLIVSTGAATMMEIDAAVELIDHCGARDRLLLLHCVSAYPTLPHDARLGCIRTLRERFDVPVGFSDHTVESGFGALAVASGAVILEKHLTLDRSLEGPDHYFSLEPAAFKEYVDAARTAHRALGDGWKVPTSAEMEIRQLARGSLVTRAPLLAGQRIAADHLIVQRPGGGIAPDRFDDVLGRTAKVDIPGDTRLDWSMLA